MVMRIKELRFLANMTQQQLAEYLGVVRGAVSNWESETSFPSAKQLPRLAEALNCNISDLFTPAQEHKGQ